MPGKRTAPDRPQTMRIWDIIIAYHLIYAVVVLPRWPFNTFTGADRPTDRPQRDWRVDATWYCGFVARCLRNAIMDDRRKQVHINILHDLTETRKEPNGFAEVVRWIVYTCAPVRYFNWHFVKRYGWNLRPSELKTIRANARFRLHVRQKHATWCEDMSGSWLSEVCNTIHLSS